MVIWVKENEMDAFLPLIPDEMKGRVKSGFDMDSRGFTEEFKSDRNLNGISCVRDWGISDNRKYRIFAAGILHDQKWSPRYY